MESKIVTVNYKKNMLFKLYEETLLAKGGINTSKQRSLLTTSLIDLYCNSLNCGTPAKTLNSTLAVSATYIDDTAQSRYEVSVPLITNATYYFSTSTPDYTIVQSNNTAIINYTGTETYCSQNVVLNITVLVLNSCSTTIQLVIPKTCRTQAECTSYLTPLTTISSTGNSGNTGWLSSVTNIPGAVYTWSFTASQPNWAMIPNNNTAQFIWSGSGLYCEHPINISLTTYIDNCVHISTQNIGIVC